MSSSKISTLYGTEELKKFIDLNGKPKKVTELLEAIKNRFGNSDEHAIDSVIHLLQDDKLGLALKLISGMKK